MSPPEEKGAPSVSVSDRDGGNPHNAITKGNCPGKVLCGPSKNVDNFCESDYERELQNRVNQRIKDMSGGDQQKIQNRQTVDPSVFMTVDEHSRYNHIQDINNQINHQQLIAFNNIMGFPADGNHQPSEAEKKKAQDAFDTIVKLCKEKAKIDDNYKPTFMDRWGNRIGQGMIAGSAAATDLAMGGGHPAEGPAPRGRAPKTSAPAEEAPSARAPAKPGSPDTPEESQAPQRKPPPNEAGAEEKPPPDGDAVKKKPKKGDPVVLTTGEFVEEFEDFFIDGTIPIRWTRHYGSSSRYLGPLGLGRVSPFDITFEDKQTHLLLNDEQGRKIVFARPFNLGATYGQRAPGLELRAPWLGELELREGQTIRCFRRDSDDVYRLTRISDLNGNTIRLVRDEKGLLVRADHSDGVCLLFSNDPRGLRLAVTLHTCDGCERPLVQYMYDSHQRLVTTKSHVTSSLTYRYDARGRLESWQDDTGRSWGRLRYDEHGRVVGTHTGGAWDGDTFAYDASARITTYRPGGGDELLRVHYDQHENILWEENALGERTTHVYRDGYRVSTTNPLGHTQRWSHDSHGNIAEFIDGEGRKTLYRWTRDGSLLFILSAGNVSRWTYDGNGNIVERQDPDKSVTRFEWTPAGRMSAVVYPDGTVERREYDHAHRLVAIEDRNGGLTKLERDEFGAIVAVTNPVGETVGFGYATSVAAPSDFVTEVRRPDGVRHQRILEPGSLTEVDGEGRSRRRDFGAFDVVKTIGDASGEIALDYDVLGRVRRVVNANGAPIVSNAMRRAGSSKRLISMAAACPTDMMPAAT